MVENKHISKIIIILMAIAVVLCLLAAVFSDKLTVLFGGTDVRMEYEYELFDTDKIIDIDIQIDEEDWNNMLKNAIQEEYQECDVVINGQRVSHVAIRPKGNTSLSAIAMDPNTDRYSFKIEFNHYVKGQTFCGLDKLILNNNYADATNMKEAVVYDMYRFLDADASLYNYAKISVNGEYWGVYLALEGVEQSFMLRNYGTQDGELYKPENMGMGAGGIPEFSNMPDMGGFDPNAMPEFGSGGFDPGNIPDIGSFDPNAMPEFGSGGFDPGNMPGGMPDFGGFSFGGGGSDLNYTDDDPDNYSTIWEGEVTKTGKKDHKRVITALKNISKRKKLEKYMDVDNILKYMAVHTFAVNMDSLTGVMAHNYYLYEYEGRLNIIPWDYNLSFGGMPMGTNGDPNVMVNFPIDSPFSSTHFFDGLLKDEEYSKRYHEYLQQLVDEYVKGGKYQEFCSRTRAQIDALVETDPTAFFSYQEYLKASDMLDLSVELRAESIDGQIKGTIPSTSEGQSMDASALIDASEIDVEAMGQFDMGGGFGGSPF